MINNMEACGCKGIRTCVICEEEGKLPAGSGRKGECMYYCEYCGKAWPGSRSPWKQHPDHQDNPIDFTGIKIIQNFVSEEEERSICEEIYKVPFAVSQSGRRKQDYGPKVNFKKKKLKCDVFTGLPNFSEPLYQRMTEVAELADFTPVELCNLEYSPLRGSAIDPHFDDFWLWGERLVTLNLLSDTFLYFIKDGEDVEVKVPLHQRSLIVVYGPARHSWKHGIHREDITGDRIAITLRELSKEFQRDDKLIAVGQKLKDIALTFQGQMVGS
ncbi:alpha-ketoglutarate-dependent dioxygenase alkB homolog 4-like isoform X1 [Mizuhopecten yessoensis]|uniref:alpha-ketoglutarate-dependent dioxygenase alkB homolog 4-like isoform X1 n=1 Tax=Mizuhopecten yessoensis TaxID=6573 RepID=UPI000B459590|nr:alpha-ketoglutarate-dependent dioxygenase alkB homolog 4-like isoform X1 [Mizuhopecten yessoensis]